MEIKDILSGFITVIQTVGFPIAVAGYLLYMHDKTLKEMSENINKLSNGLSEICGFLKGLKHD